jgi:hypothetical protein
MKLFVLLSVVVCAVYAATVDLNVYKDLTVTVGSSVVHGPVVTTAKLEDGTFSYGYFGYSLANLPTTNADAITKCELIFDPSAVTSGTSIDVTINRLELGSWSESAAGDSEVPQIFDQIGSVVFNADGTSNTLDITNACKYYLTNQNEDISLATYVTTDNGGSVQIKSHDVLSTASIVRVTYTGSSTTSPTTIAPTTTPTTTSPTTASPTTAETSAAPTTASSAPSSSPITTPGTPTIVVATTAKPGTPTTTAKPGSSTTAVPTSRTTTKAPTTGNSRNSAGIINTGIVTLILIIVNILCL